MHLVVDVQAESGAQVEGGGRLRRGVHILRLPAQHHTRIVVQARLQAAIPAPSIEGVQLDKVAEVTFRMAVSACTVSRVTLCLACHSATTRLPPRHYPMHCGARVTPPEARLPGDLCRGGTTLAARHRKQADGT